MTRKTRQTKSLEQSSRRSRIGNCSRFLDAFDPNFEDRRRRWGRSAFPGSSPRQQENHIIPTGSESDSRGIPKASKI